MGIRGYPRFVWILQYYDMLGLYVRVCIITMQLIEVNYALVRLIKPRSSKRFGHPEYSLDGPGPLIVASGTHEECLKSVFGIGVSGNYFLDG